MRTLVAITGASSGIGAVFARKLAPGHDLLLVARRQERLEDLAHQLSAEHGSHVDILTADLSKQDDLERVAHRIETDSNLTLLINNAGFGTRGLFWNAPYDQQEQMQKLHILATLRLTHAALRNLVPRDRGGIINLASVAAFIRGPGATGYAASKSWMTAFTEGLYVELKYAGSQVAVQALCPGFTYSEFHDVIGIDRSETAPPFFWLKAEYVVDASLDGLRRRKLFVVPGWQYRFLTALVTRIPTEWRLALESKSRKPSALTAVPENRQGKLP
jgi:short-subunit dehydrogenase